MGGRCRGDSRWPYLFELAHVVTQKGGPDEARGRRIVAGDAHHTSALADGRDVGGAHLRAHHVLALKQNVAWDHPRG